MSVFYAIILVLLIALAGYIWFDLTMTKWGIEMRQDFEKEFPGRCGYCAFIEYGIRHGHEEPDARPKPHACKENMRRFGGASDKQGDHARSNAEEGEQL